MKFKVEDFVGKKIYFKDLDCSNTIKYAIVEDDGTFYLEFENGEEEHFDLNDELSINEIVKDKENGGFIISIVPKSGSGDYDFYTNINSVLENNIVNKDQVNIKVAHLDLIGKNIFHSHERHSIIYHPYVNKHNVATIIDESENEYVFNLESSINSEQKVELAPCGGYYFELKSDEGIVFDFYTEVTNIIV